MAGGAILSALRHLCGHMTEPLRDLAIRTGRDSDTGTILAIINAAAQAYRGVIPDDCWTDPYMSVADLTKELADGVQFHLAMMGGQVVGVMGIQDKGGVALVRHAYVRPSSQGQGIGSALLRHLQSLTAKPLLVGTWAASVWAVRFYQSHGFRLMSQATKDELLCRYWSVSPRQRETSVVLAGPGWPAPHGQVFAP